VHKTQKAQGVSVLDQYPRWDALPSVVLSDPDTPLTSTAMLEAWMGRHGIFARPCPVSPAHGFVESRKLAATTLDDLQQELAQLWAETRAADPQGELLLTPYLPSVLNFIWRPGVITVGPGHDGATAGRDSISIPCPMPIVSEFTYDGAFSTMLRDARITDTPYVEAVQLAPGQTHPKHSGIVTEDIPSLIVTQLRNGPSGSITPDFIPAEITVTAVVQTNGEDLLEWRTRVEQMAPGTAVYHPGGNCNDHYFVHCRLHNVPIFTTRAPQVGERLVPTEGTPAPYDAKACLRGIVTGLVASLDESDRRTDAVAAIASLLHSAGHISGRDAYWLGIAAMLMTRLGYAAAIGEYRHSFRAGEWRDLSRNEVYDALFEDYFSHRAQVEQAWASFHYGQWSSSYGGPAWATCTRETIALETAMLNLIANQTPEAVAALVAQLNITVNLAHNNGWWLNKFANKTVFDQSAHGEPSRLLRTSAFIYRVHQESHAARLTWVDTLRRFRRVQPLTPYVAVKQRRASTAPPYSGAQLFAQFTQAPLSARVRTVISGRDGQPYLHVQVRPDSGLEPAIALQCYWRLDLAPNLGTIGASTGQAGQISATVPTGVFTAFKARVESRITREIFTGYSLSGSATIYALCAIHVQPDASDPESQLVVRLALPDTDEQLACTITAAPLREYADRLAERVRAQEDEAQMAYTVADADIVRSRYGLSLTGNLLMMKQTDETTDTDEDADHE